MTKINWHFYPKINWHTNLIFSGLIIQTKYFYLFNIQTKYEWNILLKILK